MLDKDLLAFLATNPPVFFVNDFRVVTASVPGWTEEAIDCVLATTTGPNQEPMGTRVRLTREAAEELVKRLEEAIQRTKLVQPQPDGTTAH